MITPSSRTFPVIRNVGEYPIGTVELQIVISCRGFRIKKGSVPHPSDGFSVPPTIWTDVELIWGGWLTFAVLSCIWQKNLIVGEAAFLSSLSFHQEKPSYFHISSVFLISNPRPPGLASWFKCWFTYSDSRPPPPPAGEIRPRWSVCWLLSTGTPLLSNWSRGGYFLLCLQVHLLLLLCFFSLFVCPYFFAGCPTLHRIVLTFLWIACIFLETDPWSCNDPAARYPYLVIWQLSWSIFICLQEWSCCYTDLWNVQPVGMRSALISSARGEHRSSDGCGGS